MAATTWLRARSTAKTTRPFSRLAWLIFAASPRSKCDGDSRAASSVVSRKRGSPASPARLRHVDVPEPDLCPGPGRSPHDAHTEFLLDARGEGKWRHCSTEW